VVEDILKVSEIGNLIKIAVSAVKYFKASTIRTGALNEAADNANERRPALLSPGNTRWLGKLNTVDSLLANKSFILTVLKNPKQCLGD
jgi:hypothetical protein